MNGPPRLGFAAKLVAALVLPVLLLAAITLALTFLTTQRYMATVDQSLNRNLAARITERFTGPISDDGAKALFDAVMALNPATEVYLLDPDGAVLHHAAPPGRTVQARVALAPVLAFLADPDRLPVYGDDPRDPGHGKVFSAAPLHDQGRLAGYLYVILGGETYRSVVDMLETNHLLRVSLVVLGATLVLAGLIGFLASRLLMRRLRGLAQAMARFQDSGFRMPLPQGLRRQHAGGDEIDRITMGFLAMADRIAEQFRALERQDGQRRELVLQLSHDLRTPLATLQGYLETLLLRWDRLGAAQREHFLRSALGFGERLERLIADLFELARLDTSDAPLRPEPFPLDELVQDVGQKLAPAAAAAGVDLRCEPAPRACFVEADLGLVERAVTNLLDNAIKFTPRGGGVTVGVAGAPGEVRVIVTDTGIGIPEEDLPHIFDRFYRGEAGSPASAGTGLGLAIVRRVADLHGGSVSVVSMPGEGSTFCLALPAREAGQTRRDRAIPRADAAAGGRR